MFGRKTKVLKLKLLTEEYERLERLAKNSETTVEAVAHALLTKKLPRDAMDAAFNQLDEEDEQSGAQNAPHDIDMHPCSFLSSDLPANTREGESQGACKHPDQLGKPCFWPGTRAHECRLFVPQIVHPSRRDRRR